MMKSRLLTAIALALFGNACIMAQKVTIDKITYLIEKGEACVYEADKDIEVANILSSVEYKGRSYPVTIISHYNGLIQKMSRSGCAFMKCEKLRSVSIPNSVRNIQSYAFAYCTSLLSLTLPNSITSIGSCAFAFSRLQEISIPNSITSIKQAAFWETPLKRIIVPDSPIEIYKGSRMGQSLDSFYGCKYITEVKCQNGDVPSYLLPHLPDDCPFMLTSRYQISNNNMVAQNVQQQAPQNSSNTITPKTNTPSSDVDVNIPQNASNNENTFAVIFANENYQEEEKVDYALNDGEMFREYCQKVLGLPEDNVHIRKDATLNNIRAEVEWMQQVAEVYNGQARFIVFYAGHGIPDEKSATAYLLPVDGKGSRLTTGYSLADLYATLGKMPAERVTVFMDACFSGSKRGEGMLASARGVAIKAKPQAPQGKMVVFSAARGDETAYPLKDKEHGLFTYYLLKKLKDTNGNVTYGELGNYLSEQVARKSIVANGKSQTPTVVPSVSVADDWESMKLK